MLWAYISRGTSKVTMAIAHAPWYKYIYIYIYIYTIIIIIIIRYISVVLVYVCVTVDAKISHLSNTYIKMLIIERFCMVSNEIRYPGRATVSIPIANSNEQLNLSI